MKYTIEHNIPAPKGRSCSYPFAEMKPGDSFLVVCLLHKADKVRERLYAAAWYYQRKHSLGQKYVTKIVSEGVRIWRVK